MARQVVRGTPYTHITSQTANQGIRAGIPKGSEGETTMSQFRGSQIDTRESRGTPYHSQAGNPDEASREVSHDRYGKVHGLNAGDQNDPASNGNGVIFDGANSYERGFSPRPEPALDSPVPRDAPRFDSGFIKTEDAAHLGSGNERGRDGLVAGGGVMSRGMVGTSKSSDKSEEQLTTDDTLPDVAPAHGE